MPDTEPNTPPMSRRLRRARGKQNKDEVPRPGPKDPQDPRGPASAPKGDRPFNRSSRHRGSGKR